MSDSGRPPNILLVMADQLAARVLPCYGHPLVQAPHIARLAAEGVTFDAAYCNSPICAPSRFSMLTGRLPTAIGAFDNASELAAAQPTLMHYLRAAGYRTILAGKMHFIGPDQLHGFHERLTTDIYPPDFAWTPDWRAGPMADRPSGISMQNVIQAGTCVRSMQMDYDDEVEFLATQRVYDLARDAGRAPFFMAVSFSHPHPPFTIDEAHWALYDHDAIDAPMVPAIPVAERDEQSRWLHASHRADRQLVSEAHLRNARHAYYGMVSYVDDKVGRLRCALEACGLAEDTIVVFASDHGEMLGERGMWYKQTFFEPSSRVPLIVHRPRQFAPRRVATPVSLVDLMPTLLDLAAAVPSHWVEPPDGASLRPVLETGRQPVRDVICEYTDMGVRAPCRMIRRDRHKYVYVHRASPLLYDMVADPLERNNLAGLPEHRALERGLHDAVLDGWSPDAVEATVLASQARRRFIRASTSDAPVDWSFHVRADDGQRFVRATGAAGAKARARFPFVPPLPDD